MKAILYAMHSEVAPPFEGGRALPAPSGLEVRELPGGILACVGGVGKVNAALAAQVLLDRFDVTELWNAGVAGCFLDLPAGTLIVGSACVQHDMEIFGEPVGQLPVLNKAALPCAAPEADLATLAAAGFQAKTGVVATGDWFGRNFPRARRIRDRFNALVCDMEAGAMAQVCARAGVPFHTLKIVSDHLFHPSQYEEYQASLPNVTARLGRALAAMMGV